MFSYCPLLSDLKPIENWNVSNRNDLKDMLWKASTNEQQNMSQMMDQNTGQNMSQNHNHNMNSSKS